MWPISFCIYVKELQHFQRILNNTYLSSMLKAGVLICKFLLLMHLIESTVISASKVCCWKCLYYFGSGNIGIV